MTPTIRFKRLPHGDGLPLPERASKGAAGIDLSAAQSIRFTPGSVAIGTGFEIEMPPGYVGMIRSRSGLAFRKKIFAFHGTIDSDFRGEIRVLLRYVADDSSAPPILINRGDRIAQLIIVPVATPVIVEAAELGETERGKGGFGSTG